MLLADFNMIPRISGSLLILEFFFAVIDFVNRLTSYFSKTNANLLAAQLVYA